MSQVCPCGSKANYQHCCGRYIDLGVAAPDPERLMRSRYTAYVVNNSAYLRKTWHPDTCPDLTDLAQEQTTWLGLEVLRSQARFKQGLVEFTARFEAAGVARSMHEISRFRKVKNRWLYLDAVTQWPGDPDVT